MPKVKTLRKHRVSTHPYQQTNEIVESEQVPIISNVNNENDVGDGKVSLSRGQRRRVEKQQRVLRKQGKVALEGFKVFDKKAKEVKSPSTSNIKEASNSMLSELEAALLESSSNSQVIKPAAKVVTLTNKSKHQIAIRETARMKLVQSHPSFLQDPLAAMKAHLEQVVALKESNRSK